MSTLSQISVPLTLTKNFATSCATLNVVKLPTLPGPLWDASNLDIEQTEFAPYQAVEGAEYKYVFEISPPITGGISTNRPDLFIPDSDTGISGRFRSGLFTGFLPLNVYYNGEMLGECGIEIRSRKLNYLTDYRWMMRDVAGKVAELSMQQFAPTQQRYTQEFTRDAGTLYQKFAFLHHFLTDEAFLASVYRILARPCVFRSNPARHSG